MRETTPVTTVKLGRPWGPYAAGTEVEVDVNKAATLDELGYLAREEEKPRRRKR